MLEICKRNVEASGIEILRWKHGIHFTSFLTPNTHTQTHMRISYITKRIWLKNFQWETCVHERRVCVCFVCF